jgi:hypothetical protein
VAVEVRGGEQRRRRVLNQRLLVRLGLNPEVDYIRRALPGVRVDRVRPWIAEADERLPAHLVDRIATVYLLVLLRYGRFTAENLSLTAEPYPGFAGCRILASLDRARPARKSGHSYRKDKHHGNHHRTHPRISAQPTRTTAQPPSPRPATQARQPAAAPSARATSAPASIKPATISRLRAGLPTYWGPVRMSRTAQGPPWSGAGRPRRRSGPRRNRVFNHDSAGTAPTIADLGPGRGDGPARAAAPYPTWPPRPRGLRSAAPRTPRPPSPGTVAGPTTWSKRLVASRRWMRPLVLSGTSTSLTDLLALLELRGRSPIGGP